MLVKIAQVATVHIQLGNGKASAIWKLGLVGSAPELRLIRQTHTRS